MDSKIGLIIQFSGILLIAVLFVFLTHSLRSDALRYWRNAWLALAGALVCLSIAFNFDSLAKPFFVFYYLGEYAFAYLVIAGCRNYDDDVKIAARDWRLAVPAVAAALLLSFPIGDFNEVFNFHSLAMAAFFVIAYFALKPAASNQFRPSDLGWRVMKIALALLALDFFHYTIIFSLRNTSYPQFLGSYLSFNSIIDLVLEILFGFGMVIVLLERVRRETEEANGKLREANDKLENLAHVDPLTTAFTRHAFYGFLQKKGADNAVVSGSVGVFDVDNLKPINDGYGHHAGDLAISRVAGAIRSLVRADDLLFRWGGDEFFVVMLGFDDAQARERMSRLNLLLEDVSLHGIEAPMTIGVSYGFAYFKEIGELEQAAKAADAEMYKAKQKRKQEQKTADAIYLMENGQSYSMEDGEWKTEKVI